MTLPALRLIMADLAKCIPETVLPSSTWEDLFWPEHLHDVVWCPQLIICDRLEDETERTIKWEDAMKWRTVQDVMDYLEAREAGKMG
jgi:hypothetical protein